MVLSGVVADAGAYVSFSAMPLFAKRTARALWQAGDRARDVRDWTSARDAYAKALKLVPSRCGLWVQYGHAAKEGGDLDEAEAAYRTALVIEPNRADTHLHLGRLLGRRGRWREAESHFARLVELAPTDESRSELAAARAHRQGGAGQESIDDSLRSLSDRVKGTTPNLTHFGRRFADYEIAMLNIKNIGYALARALGDNLRPRTLSAPPADRLASKLCTQVDIESDWMAYWAAVLKSPVRYHRKLWEFCYVAQALSQAGKLEPGMAGLGFGCGDEPLVGVFAKHGVRVLASDKPPNANETQRWPVAGGDLVAYRAHYAELCPQPELRQNIDFRGVDMRDIPADLHGKFDFCWSACALEHLGTIELGLKFIEASLKTLKPGGVAVHTTEFNLDDGETVDNWGTVLFQRRHMLELAERLGRQGYRVAELDFNPGDGFLDGFVDLPPWPNTEQGLRVPDPDAHLKLALDGFICTSFGLSITVPGG
jgi:tetratricopeptide (TPR) repeat protein